MQHPIYGQEFKLSQAWHHNVIFTCSKTSVWARYRYFVKNGTITLVRVPTLPMRLVSPFIGLLALYTDGYYGAKLWFKSVFCFKHYDKYQYKVGTPLARKFFYTAVLKL